MAITVYGVTYNLPDDLSKLAAMEPAVYMAAKLALRKSASDRVWESVIEDMRKGFARSNAWEPAVRAAPHPKWPTYRKLISPFPVDEGEPERRLFGSWFNYFWDEASTAALSPSEEDQLYDAFFAIFDGNGKPRPDLAELENYELLKALVKLLELGFVRVRTVPGRLMFARSLSVEAVSPARLFASSFIDSQRKGHVLPIGFRADDRSYETLARSGFLAKARTLDEAYLGSLGLNRQWHPYHLGTFRDSMFLRRGHNKDNCVNSVVSVATTIEQSIQYPMLHDPSVFRLAKTPPQNWSSGDYGYARDTKKLTYVTDLAFPKVRIHDTLISPTYVYLLDMSHSYAFNTQGWQASQGSNESDERALDHVDPLDILAMGVVNRHYFYRQDKEVWDIYKAECASFQSLQSEERLRRTFGNLTLVNIESTFKRHVTLFDSNRQISKNIRDQQRNPVD